MDIGGLLQQVQKRLPQSDLELIGKAYRLANQAHMGQVRASGEPYIQHPSAVARILAELGLDGSTIAAGLLHDVAEDSAVNIDELRREFGGSSARLLVLPIHNPQGVIASSINEAQSLAQPDPHPLEG